MNFFLFLMSLFLRRFVLAERLQRLEEKKKLYKTIRDNDKIYHFQLERLNQQWKKAYVEIPFYKEWKEKHRLPDYISSIGDLKSFPPLTKDVIYKNQDFIQKGLINYYLTSTGGTSGVTTHFPTSKYDAVETYSNAYLGRSWWGIEPL
ncbi:MAG: hypothetical protein HQK84_09675 [Nitrospinae bacterium]|nr:hypothetical protein [Nitrospinota bacterium]